MTTKDRLLQILDSALNDARSKPEALSQARADIQEIIGRLKSLDTDLAALEPSAVQAAVPPPPPAPHMPRLRFVSTDPAFGGSPENPRVCGGEI